MSQKYKSRDKVLNGAKAVFLLLFKFTEVLEIQGMQKWENNTIILILILENLDFLHNKNSIVRRVAGKGRQGCSRCPCLLHLS